MSLDMSFMLSEDGLEQIDKWVSGYSVHDIDSNQCCPDFSCCGGPLASYYSRVRFRQALIEEDYLYIYPIIRMFYSMRFPHLPVAGFHLI